MKENTKTRLSIVALMVISWAIGIATGIIIGCLHQSPAMGEVFSLQGAGTSYSSTNPAPTYYHSIPEMQIWCGAYPDGIWGMETDRMYKIKRSEQYGNLCAVEFMEMEYGN